MANQFDGRVQQDMEVWSADGHKLGKVVRTTGNDFWVEKGFFFPKEYQVACADITDVSGDRIALSRRRDELGMERGFAESLGFGKHGAAPLRSAKRLEEHEKIRVSKDQVASQAPVSTTVRREVAEVEQTGGKEDEVPRRKTGTLG